MTGNQLALPTPQQHPEPLRNLPAALEAQLAIDGIPDQVTPEVHAQALAAQRELVPWCMPATPEELAGQIGRLLVQFPLPNRMSDGEIRVWTADRCKLLSYLPVDVLAYAIDRALLESDRMPSLKVIRQHTAEWGRRQALLGRLLWITKAKPTAVPYRPPTAEDKASVAALVSGLTAKMQAA